MRLEVSVSAANATAATVNHPKAVVPGNVYHVVNTNDIPTNRMAIRKCRGVHCKGNHKLSMVILRDSILGTSFRDLSTDILYSCMTANLSEAFILDKVKLEIESKQSFKHTYACDTN